MSLSKVYRGEEFRELESFEFRSFSEGKSSGVPVADSLAAPSTAPPVTTSGLQQEVTEAFQRGRQEGATAVESKLDNTLQALTQALEDVGHMRESLARNSSQDMLRMVMAISEQVIRRSLDVKPEIVLSLIENALRSSVQADSYRIRVSPQDFELVNQQKPLFLASISGMKNISISSDAEISPGGCRVESDFGDVDATIETQLEEIRKVLVGAIAGVD
jgi:flagellar assembly protein FliH